MGLHSAPQNNMHANKKHRELLSPAIHTAALHLMHMAEKELKT